VIYIDTLLDTDHNPLNHLGLVAREISPAYGQIFFILREDLQPRHQVSKMLNKPQLLTNIENMRWIHLLTHLAIVPLILAALPLTIATDTEDDATEYECNNSVYLYLKDDYLLTPSAPEDGDPTVESTINSVSESPYRFLPWLNYYVPVVAGYWQSGPVARDMEISGMLDFHIWIGPSMDESTVYINFTFTINDRQIVKTGVTAESFSNSGPNHLVVYKGLPGIMSLKAGDVLGLLVNCTITSDQGIPIYYGSNEYPSGVRIGSSDSLHVQEVKGDSNGLVVHMQERFGIGTSNMYYRAWLNEKKLPEPDVKMLEDYTEITWPVPKNLNIEDHHRADIIVGYSHEDNITIRVLVAFPESGEIEEEGPDHDNTEGEHENEAEGVNDEPINGENIIDYPDGSHAGKEIDSIQEEEEQMYKPRNSDSPGFELPLVIFILGFIACFGRSRRIIRDLYTEDP